jgi:hypothetical protein
MGSGSPDHKVAENIPATVPEEPVVGAATANGHGAKESTNGHGGGATNGHLEHREMVKEVETLCVENGVGMVE